MKLIITLALLFAASLPAQTITRDLTLTLDTDKIEAIKLWIATVDQNDATEFETDVSNAEGLTYIQNQIDLLVKRMQRVAVRKAAEAGRTDLLPVAYQNEVTAEAAAIAARDSQETAGAGVQ